ncbi:MAG: hypothetical protein BHW64_02405 [Candidatus Melainabacteria bacterium LEY3_CP_29_8]|nr:MAG: hypothetical protein BHW64_02405 [Candidatus Melainabacteria bacterium LEY3_CP_29_8]
MNISKMNLNNSFNKVQFKQNNDDKNKYIYVNQSSIDNFKLPLGMGLIYSQFEFILKAKVFLKSVNQY